MSDGLRALVRAAGSEPLRFFVSILAGQMIINGRPAPSSWFYHATLNGLRSQVWDSVEHVVGGKERREQYHQAVAEPLSFLKRAAAEDTESESAEDELTLAEVSLFPATEAAGTKSGGLQLPAMRVPYSAIGSWWIVEGQEIAGRNASVGGIGFGITLPL